MAGHDVLHLQCHPGFDAVTPAQRGARVVGADFSPVALEKARAIAARAGVEVEYVEADSTALPLETEPDPRGDVLTRDEDGLYRLRLGGTPVPVLYTLVAAKP